MVIGFLGKAELVTNFFFFLFFCFSFFFSERKKRKVFFLVNMTEADGIILDRKTGLKSKEADDRFKNLKKDGVYIITFSYELKFIKKETDEILFKNKNGEEIKLPSWFFFAVNPMDDDTLAIYSKKYIVTFEKYDDENNEKIIGLNFKDKTTCDIHINIPILKPSTALGRATLNLKIEEYNPTTPPTSPPTNVLDEVINGKTKKKPSPTPKEDNSPKDKEDEVLTATALDEVINEQTKNKPSPTPKEDNSPKDKEDEVLTATTPTVLDEVINGQTKNKPSPRTPTTTTTDMFKTMLGYNNNKQTVPYNSTIIGGSKRVRRKKCLQVEKFTKAPRTTRRRKVKKNVKCLHVKKTRRHI
jgi:hypothetical protein